ncbi:hypothetical protein C4K26_5991 [Pseudomonas chlororaphis]|uniref:hypothetical protein n=1 Tax=Pseudomonas chlororaphis TaxID=587753 RepID=UPI000F57E884|nr:hypothetical protein [Pseudomonas chlororaphis]AZD11349.1 hypothetical protein C4K26_5991 [Pseudomonas chlororaphis]
MKEVFALLLFLVGCYVFSVSACEVPESRVFPALKADNGYIVFNEVPLVGVGGTPSVDEISIDVVFFNCISGKSTRISGLPFLAATGQVHAAFFADAKDGGGEKLFIIHSVEIASDTGINYSGDYYTVHVYAKSSAGYIRDDRISNYFGVGGDILLDINDTVLKCRFPYKTSEEIVKRLESDLYRKWVAGEKINLKIQSKTAIYSSPNTADVTRMYLVGGDMVLREGIEAGWVKVMFKTPKNKEVRGWIMCKAVDGC